MIYILVFAATTLLLYASGRCSGALRAILVVLALLLPCCLAGLRDETVGDDVLTYAKQMSENAQNMGLSEYMSYEWDLAQPGWNLFTWVVVRLTGGLSGYLFCIEALCIVPVYLGLRRMCGGWEWLGVLVWLLLLYPFSLNGMRQCAAMGIVFYSTAYVLERRPLPFVAEILVAFLFHQTGIVGIAIYLFAFVCRYSGGISKLLGRWRSTVVFTLALCAVVSCIVLGDQIVLALAFLKDSYSHQVNSLGVSDFSWAGLYLTAMTAALWALSRKDLVSRQKYESIELAKSKVVGFDIVCGVSLLGSLLMQLNLVADGLGRLGYYGIALLPLAVAWLGKWCERSRGHIILGGGLAAVYFIITTLVLQMSGAFPYNLRTSRNWVTVSKLSTLACFFLTSPYHQKYIKKEIIWSRLKGNIS